jgi:hypothetical protein
VPTTVAVRRADRTRDTVSSEAASVSITSILTPSTSTRFGLEGSVDPMRDAITAAGEDDSLTRHA